ncbi:peptidase C60 sortase A and B [Catenulispora acidiphila DSM 44928]|uniref:Peptidase C60 sortase A and B n=2 Tax=Catenulispora TaxID=414878 RepID=C7QE74_CATAD|nr:peptidase C60 sortase A and B [Catenulispora acidiphila DSM 44928]
MTDPPAIAIPIGTPATDQQHTPATRALPVAKHPTANDGAQSGETNGHLDLARASAHGIPPSPQPTSTKSQTLDPSAALPCPDPRRAVPNLNPSDAVPSPDPSGAVANLDPSGRLPGLDPSATLAVLDPSGGPPSPGPSAALRSLDPSRASANLNPSGTLPSPDPGDALPSLDTSGALPSDASLPPDPASAHGPVFSPTGRPATSERPPIAAPDSHIGHDRNRASTHSTSPSPQPTSAADHSLDPNGALASDACPPANPASARGPVFGLIGELATSERPPIATPDSHIERDRNRADAHGTSPSPQPTSAADHSLDPNGALASDACPPANPASTHGPNFSPTREPAASNRRPATAPGSHIERDRSRADARGTSSNPQPTSAADHSLDPSGALPSDACPPADPASTPGPIFSPIGEPANSERPPATAPRSHTERDRNRIGTSGTSPGPQSASATNQLLDPNTALASDASLPASPASALGPVSPVDELATSERLAIAAPGSHIERDRSRDGTRGILPNAQPASATDQLLDPNGAMPSGASPPADRNSAHGPVFSPIGEPAASERPPATAPQSHVERDRSWADARGILPSAQSAATSRSFDHSDPVPRDAPLPSDLASASGPEFQLSSELATFGRRRTAAFDSHVGLGESGGGARGVLPSGQAASVGGRLLDARGALPSDAAGVVDRASVLGPVFNLIGERVAFERPRVTTSADSHVEVGVRGKARSVPKPAPSPVVPQSEVRQPGRVLAFASVVAVVVGSGFLVRALMLTDPVPPPLPPAWAGRVVGAVGHRAGPLGYARPVRVSVARVGIHADVLALGLTQEGGVGVPPAKEPLKAAWYDRGPAPGEAGPAVITGHVDSRFAPGNRAAFYELGAVRPGDAVDVVRADHRVAVFRVDSVALVPKAGFPTRQVYGPTGYAALRLITCGGHYDRRTGYADNVIVYAHLVGSR